MIFAELDHFKYFSINPHLRYLPNEFKHIEEFLFIVYLQRIFTIWNFLRLFLANIFRLDTLKKSFYPFINIFLFLHNHTVYFTLLSAPFQSNFHFPNFYSLLCHPFQHYFLLSYMCVSYELFP